MSNYFHKLGALVLIFSFVFSVSSLMVPVANAAEPTGVCKSTADVRVIIDAVDDIDCTNKGGRWDGPSTSSVLDRITNAFFNTGKSVYDTLDCAGSPLDCALRNFAAMMATLVLKLASLLTMIGGVVLNGAILHTVVNMDENYRNLTVINEAWKVVRDVSNMAFIFVLLYAAIQQILGIGKNVKELIVKVIVVAILINFSLFFTQFVIDISNLFTLTFYDAIVPGQAGGGLTGSVGVSTTGGAPGVTAGLSDAFMRHLNLQNLYSVDGQTMINFEGIITTGIMGSILLLISAFVFFAAGLMFIIRYVVLIMVLILSPIAFVAYILPSGTDAEKYKKQWMDALLGQAFFAPIYMMLTWVTLKVLSGVTSSFGAGSNLSQTGEIALTVAGNAQNAQGLMSVFTNFIVVIAFLIFSLVVAKDWASRTPGGVGKLTSMAMGAAGASTFGLGGWVGRRTVGAWGANTADNAELQRRAREGTGIDGAKARLSLYARQKARSGSFDFRNSSLPTSAIGDAIEGTVGRTSLGRKIGLDEVRIGNIPVGSVATDQLDSGKAATEGVREERAAKEKRMDAARKASDDEYRKAEAKEIIDAVVNPSATVPTPGEILKMQEKLKDMSAKEITALDKNTLANEHVAEALTASQLKAIDDDKDGKFSESDKKDIFGAHFKNVAEAVNALTTGLHPTTGTALSSDEKEAYKKAIKGISDKEVDYIPNSIFDPAKLDPIHTGPEAERSRTFLKTITQAQVDNMTKGEKMPASQRQAIKDSRALPLKDAFTPVAGGGIRNAVEAMKIMREMRPEALVQLDDAKLTNVNILEIYRPGLLNKMAARSELTEAKASAIRLAIRDAVYTPPAGFTPSPELIETQEWLEDDGLKIF